jgi:hypothetical protein
MSYSALIDCAVNNNGFIVLQVMRASAITVTRITVLSLQDQAVKLSFLKLIRQLSIPP